MCGDHAKDKASDEQDQEQPPFEEQPALEEQPPAGEEREGEEEAEEDQQKEEDADPPPAAAEGDDPPGEGEGAPPPAPQAPTEGTNGNGNNKRTARDAGLSPAQSPTTDKRGRGGAGQGDLEDKIEALDPEVLAKLRSMFEAGQVRRLIDDDGGGGDCGGDECERRTTDADALTPPNNQTHTQQTTNKIQDLPRRARRPRGVGHRLARREPRARGARTVLRVRPRQRAAQGRLPLGRALSVPAARGRGEGGPGAGDRGAARGADGAAACC